MDVENNFESTFREDSSYNSFIESLENIYISSSSSVELSIPQYTLIENTTTISVGNLKTCSLSELDESTEEASIYEIMKKIKQIGEDKLINNSYMIKELNNGCVVFSTYNKKIYLYNDEFNFLFEMKFPYMINSINEVQNNNPNLIELICCSIFYIYIISYDIALNKLYYKMKTIDDDIENELNLNDIKNDFGGNINLPKKKYNYIYMIERKNGNQIFCTNNGVYETENILNTQRKMQEIILSEQYLECISLNDELICLKSNKQISNGKDRLTFFNLNTKNIVNQIDGYSFTLYSNRLILVPLDEKGEKQILIASCTKYSKSQKNGILVINIDIKNKQKMETKTEFLETEFFSINCICNLNDKKKDNDKKDIYFLAGGVDSEYSKGMVKLYKIYEEEGKTCIEFLQEVLSEETFEGTISYIHQLKNGKIIISAGNGEILFSSPNLNGYKEDDF